MKNKYIFLQPTYYKDFKCSGSECSLNCCNFNWTILVDKQSYLKYKKLRKPDYFVSILNKYIKRNRKNHGTLDYAKMIQQIEPTEITYKIIKDGVEKTITEEYYLTSCAFQDENGLCEIHKNLGEDGLCYTCKSYPRIFNNILNNYERSLYVGCEEVSKLFYNLKDGISFEIIEDVNYINYKYLVNLPINNNKILYYFDDIRITCLNLLQSRQYSLDDRMILLSILLFKIDELRNNNKYDDIIPYLNKFFDNISIYETILNINKENQYLLLSIIGSVIFYSMNNKQGTKELTLKLKEILFNLEKSILELKNNENTTTSPLYNKYKSHRSKLISEKEYFIENIFVNLFFSHGLPFNGANSIKESCIMFIFTYIFYKSLLAYYLVDEIMLNESLLHRVTTVFGRLCGDQPMKLLEILSSFKDNEIDSLAHLAILIKSA